MVRHAALKMLCLVHLSSILSRGTKIFITRSQLFRKFCVLHGNSENYLTQMKQITHIDMAQANTQITEGNNPIVSEGRYVKTGI